MLVRYYRVPKGNPVLPIPHAFMTQENWDRKQSSKLEDSDTVVGELMAYYRYDKGRLPTRWRRPTKYIGTPEQWLQGSESTRHQPLVWRGEFSVECRGEAPNPQGMACAKCEECGLTSPIWMVDGFEDFAGLTQAAVVYRGGCEWNSKCVAPGTAAAWEVMPEESFGGLTGGVIYSTSPMVWSGCCKEIV